MKCFNEQDFYILFATAVLSSAFISFLFDYIVNKLTSKKRVRKAKK
jgi:hypothetical protein